MPQPGGPQRMVMSFTGSGPSPGRPQACESREWTRWLEPAPVQGRGLARAPETQRSRCPAERGRRRAALPGPETPLLSAAEQHGVQGREGAQPAHVQRSDPGAVELKGKARPRLSGASPGRPPHACPAGPAAVPPVSAPGMSESPKPSRGRAGAGPSFPAGWQQGPPTTTWQDF